MDDVDLFDVIHADVEGEHGAVGGIPGEPVGVAEAVGVDLAERLRIVVGGELVGHRDGVVAKPFGALGNSGTAWIDAQDRRDE